MADFDWSSFFSGFGLAPTGKDQSRLAASPAGYGPSGMTGLSLDQVQNFGVALGSGVSAPVATSSGSGSWLDNLANVFGGTPGKSSPTGTGQEPTLMPQSVTPGASNPAPGGTLGADGSGVDWQDWASRGVVVILGFIFVAVGLALFGRQPMVAVKQAVLG